MSLEDTHDGRDLPCGALITVVDPADPRLDLYRDLNDPPRRVHVEAEHSIFVVEGRLSVERLLTSSYPIRSLLVDDHQISTAGALVTAARERGAPVYVCPRDVMAATVGFDFHRGIIALAARAPMQAAEHLLADAARAPLKAGSPPVVAILEGLNDHENIGALFRNAAAFGVSGILLDPSSADPLYRRSIRVSVGHALHVPFARLTPWPTGLRHAQDAGFLVCAMTPHPWNGVGTPVLSLGSLRDFVSDSDSHRGLALLFGAEGPGLTREALAAADLAASIPMATSVDSLNVATAAAIAFHAVRAG